MINWDRLIKEFKLVFGFKIQEETNIKRKEISTDDQLIPLEDLVLRYKTDINKGLTSEEAHRRLAKDGPNRLTPSEGVPEYIKFLKQLFGGFSLLLWIGSILCLVSFCVDKNTDNVSSLRCFLFW